jgi:ATP-dependent DNA helicase RecQ
MVGVINKLALLRHYFGHSGFRQGQEELIDVLLSGGDVLGVMPTGAGKSVCYQLPALLLPGLTLVISPLISLMKDQVNALAQNGISSACINSSLSAEQYSEVYRHAYKGAYKIIYVAPERLTTADFLRFAEETEISLLAVDEAHCVSQWGHDFRPGYLNIPEFIACLSRRPPVGAFTATATEIVKADIERLLRLQNPLCVTTGFNRPNIHFEVLRPKNKYAALCALLADHSRQSTIVYCAARKTVESVCADLRQNGIAATRYHAGLEDYERKQNQEDFVYDRAKVMVATNAFGMGIDKSNVSLVVHYNMPKNIESYYQEAGRAGRDGENAFCTLFFSAADIQTAKFLINNGNENEALSEDERRLIHQRDLRQLEQMIAYCKTTACLRAYLLNYFGEEAAANCGNCGNCDGEIEQLDITLEAQKILSAVARVEKKYASGLGLTLIIRMLSGSREQRIKRLDLDRLPTWGIMRDIARDQIRDYADYLIAAGYLFMTADEYPVLRLTEKAREVLFRGERILYARRKQSRAEKTVLRQKASREALPSVDEDLFAALKALRSKQAQKENVPAYIIFSNAALADMAAKRPQSPAEFLRINGVGDIKAARYGKIFLTAIHNWLKEE